MDNVIGRLIQKEVDAAVYDKMIAAAKKMIAKNKPTDEIVEFTGLTEDEIEALREQQ